MIISILMFLECDCNIWGSKNDSCDENGQCYCNFGYYGLNCDHGM